MCGCCVCWIFAMIISSPRSRLSDNFEGRLLNCSLCSPKLWSRVSQKLPKHKLSVPTKAWHPQIFSQSSAGVREQILIGGKKLLSRNGKFFRASLQTQGYGRPTCLSGQEETAAKRSCLLLAPYTTKPERALPITKPSFCSQRTTSRREQHAP